KKQSTNSNRYLRFSLGSEEYAIPLLSVKEVIAVPDITPIPYTPPHFLGIMNLRGQVISVIDLRLKLNIKSSQSQETAIIICDIHPYCVGIVVDSINSVITAKAEELSEKPQIQSTKNTDFITEIYNNSENLIVLIDIAKTLDLDDHKAINKSLNQGKQVSTN
ncbi:MAG: chemotaxis protein CheW, partial [Silvanigrellaceae bacterium]|nr:chemotaxis protein CheW [Silvanigrellaceae bacterium]